MGNRERFQIELFCFPSVLMKPSFCTAKTSVILAIQLDWRKLHHCLLEAIKIGQRSRDRDDLFRSTLMSSLLRSACSLPPCLGIAKAMLSTLRLSPGVLHRSLFWVTAETPYKGSLKLRWGKSLLWTGIPLSIMPDIKQCSGWTTNSRQPYPQGWVLWV